MEPRDDETQILSQISAAFVAFYNQFVDKGDSYAQARQLTEDYYQEIVLTDVLPAYVGQSTINRYLHTNSRGGVSVSTPNLPSGSFTPIEFSVGAYHFGHSLVRNDYHINDIFPTTLDIGANVPIFDLANFQTGDLSGGAPLPGPNGSSTTTCTSTSFCNQPDPAGHQIQWKYFVPALDANPNDPGINFARQTQTTISPALFNLPAETIAGCADAPTDPACIGSGALIARDFARGNYDGLASGQDIARALGCHVISPDPRLVKLAPETPSFSFGDLLVDTGLAPRSS